MYAIVITEEGQNRFVLNDETTGPQLFESGDDAIEYLEVARESGYEARLVPTHSPANPSGKGLYLRVDAPCDDLVGCFYIGPFHSETARQAHAQFHEEVADLEEETIVPVGCLPDDIGPRDLWSPEKSLEVLKESLEEEGDE